MSLNQIKIEWAQIKHYNKTKLVYMSSMLTSKKPRFIPMFIWRRFNAIMNRIVTLPICFYYSMVKGFYVVYPGNFQGPLIKHYGIDGNILSFWLECIEDGCFDIVVKGWRADGSPGATAELELAEALRLPIINLIGRQIN